MPYLQLESKTYGVLPLNGVFNETKGVEALAGATGLGLPPVSANWREGAGDGATFRFKRLLGRDIDIPIYVLDDDREALKAALSHLAKIITDEVTIRFVEDDGTSWYTTGHRSGGGDYVYGTDTQGEDDLVTVLSFRTGSPYWLCSEETKLRVSNPTVGRGLLNGPLTALKVSNTGTIGQMAFDNQGDADSYPIWEITGPGNTLILTSSKGETLTYPGVIPSGSKVFIDSENGTVRDASGANLYAGLGPAPQFWTIPPGKSRAIVSMASPSPGNRGRTGLFRTNWVKNPRLGSVDLTTTFKQVADTASHTAAVLSRDTTKGYRDLVSLKATVPAKAKGVQSFTLLVPGLTVGKSYTVTCWSFNPSGTGNQAVNHPAIVSPVGAVSRSTVNDDWFFHSLEFKATAVSQEITFELNTYRTIPDSAVPTYAVNFDNFCVTETDASGSSGQTFFAGDTPSTPDYDYVWSGTANASPSIEYQKGPLGVSAIQVSYRARKQAVI